MQSGGIYAYNISISSNPQLNQTTPHISHDTTTTYTANLDLRSKWLQERLAWDMAGTYYGPSIT